MTCVDLSRYAIYILVDPEEEFFASERQRLFSFVQDFGLNLVVFADWFNASTVEKIRFLDENTKYLFAWLKNFFLGGCVRLLG